MNGQDHSAAWETWRTERRLDNGTTVSYIDVGAGPVAVFVHGILVSGYLWRHVVEETRRDRRCIVIDLLGHGATIAGPSARFSMTSQAEMIVSLLESLEIETVDLVGNDTGGGVCQVIAARKPELLRSLVVTNSDTHDNWPPNALDTIEQIAKAHALADTATALLADPDAARSEIGFGVGYQHPERLTNDAVHSYLEPFVDDPSRATLVEDFINNPELAELTVLEPQLRRLDVPTLVVWGTADIFFGIDWAHWLHSTIPGCDRVVELEGAKLFFPDDRAEDLVPLLQQHWSAVGE